MADGYARVTGKPQCVLVHTDVGTQALSCAVHNAHIARTPVLIFAGLCPITIEGEQRGSRTEWVNYLQDVPNQRAIVGQYCRYTGEIRSGKNIKQMVNRALQFAASNPKGPVYLCAAREPLEEEIEPYHLDQLVWQPVGPAGLPQEAVEQIANALIAAKEPLIVTGYSGRNVNAPGELVKLADLVKGLRVLDTSIGDVCFPANHPGWLGGKYAAHESIETADVILVLDCDVPWVPTQCRPRKDAIIIHIDVDPLKQNMPVFYIDAVGRWAADAFTALKQLNAYILSTPSYAKLLSSNEQLQHEAVRLSSYNHLIKRINSQATPSSGPSTGLNAALITAALKRTCPANTLWCVEVVTNTFFVADQLQCTIPGSFISSGATGLGWSGGASIGIKLAAKTIAQKSLPTTNPLYGPDNFVVCIISDGTYLFSHPSPVYWIASRYHLPTLTIILNNKGWNAPRKSLQLVHPNGIGSRISNRDLNISFDDPSPDYAGIAKAASGGRIWTGYADTVGELDGILEKAVETVRKGTGAVIECRLPGMEGKVDGAGAEEAANGGEAAKATNGSITKRKFDEVAET